MSHHAPQDGRYPAFPMPPQAYQPTATESMQVVPGGGRNTRNLKNLPVGSDGRHWSHGLCGCCCNEYDTWCLALCIPSVIYAKNKRRLDYLNEKNRPDPKDGGGCCSATCWGHCCGGGCCLQMASRKAVRKRYNISGDGCGDCLTVMWCSSCSLTQESREINLEEEGLLKG